MLHPRFIGGYYMKLSERIGKTFPNFVDFVIKTLKRANSCPPDVECRTDPHWTPFNAM